MAISAVGLNIAVYSDECFRLPKRRHRFSSPSFHSVVIQSYEPRFAWITIRENQQVRPRFVIDLSRPLTTQSQWGYSSHWSCRFWDSERSMRRSRWTFPSRSWTARRPEYFQLFVIRQIEIQQRRTSWMNILVRRNYLYVDYREIAVSQSDNAVDVLNSRTEESAEGTSQARSSCLSIASVVSSPYTVHISGERLVQCSHS